MGRLIGRAWTAIAVGILTLVSLGGAAGAFEADDLVFASGDRAGEIVAIDTISDRVVMRYPVPGRIGQVLVAREAGRVIALSKAPAAIYFFDIGSGRRAESIEPDFDVTGLRLAAGGEVLAAAGPGTVAVIDVMGGKLARKIPVDATPGAMIFDKSGEILFVGDRARNRIHMIDLRRDGGVETLDLAAGGERRSGILHLARTPGGSTGMAVDGAGGAAILDLAARRVTSQLSLPGRQARIFPTVNSQYFLIPNRGDASVSIISTWTYQESERLRMRADISALNTVLADTVLFAFDGNSKSVEVFDLDHRRRHRDIKIPGHPVASVVGPGGLKLYVAFRDRPQIAIIDARALRVVSEIDGIGFAADTIVNGGKLSFCH